MKTSFEDFLDRVPHLLNVKEADRSSVAASARPEVMTTGPAVAGEIRGSHPWGIPKPYALAASLIAVALFCGASAAGLTAYRFAQLLHDYKELHKQLGLNEPVTAGEFAVIGGDTLTMNATIDLRSVQRVVFRAQPGEEKVLYEREERPTEFKDSIERISIHHAFSMHKQGRFEVEVEFIPYADVAQYFPDNLRKKSATLVVIPPYGVFVNLKQVIQLNTDEPLDPKMQTFDIKGASFVDGWMALFLRAEGTQDWYLQNFKEPVQLVAGKPFFVPCHIGDPVASSYELEAVVVQNKDDLNLAVSRVQRIEQVAPADAVFERVRRTLSVIPSDRQRPGDESPRQPPIAITFPSDKAVVEGLQTEIKLKLMPGGEPLVFVRPAVGSSQWYLQPELEPPTTGSSEWTGFVRLGDSNTPDGTKFQIVALLVTDQSILQELSERESRSELPSGITLSNFVTVTRQ